MDVFTKLPVLWIIGIITVFASGTCALQCYDCTYIRLETSNSIVNQALNFISSFNDEACQFRNEEDRLEVDIRTCPEPESGSEAKCAVIKGEVATEIQIPLYGGVPLKYYSVERNCIEVPSNDDDYDGCHDELTSVSQEFVKSIIEDDLGGDLGSIDFTGEACYYDELTDSVSMVNSNIIFVLLLCAFSVFLKSL